MWATRCKLIYQNIPKIWVNFDMGPNQEFGSSPFEMERILSIKHLPMANILKQNLKS
jgi:hypothetical protein